MEEFKASLRNRRVTVLSGLKQKMDVLRTENQFLKELLHIHNIECPPLSELTSTPLTTDDDGHTVDCAESPEVTDCGEYDIEGSDVTPVEIAPCHKCADLESEIARTKNELSRTQNDLQEANAQLVEQTSQVQSIRNHCQALKDVNRIIKELIGIRDQELSQLKEKLKEIEQTMSERETEMLSENLRTEYTRQLENIRRLKTLYEQRARSADAEIEILKRKLADKNTEVDNELLKNEEKEHRITAKEVEIDKLNTELSNTRDTLKDTKNEMELLQNDLQAINMLFTRILTNKDNFDLDRLKNVLEENRMLLSEVTTRSNDCSIIADSVLPKLLCDLIVGAFAEPEIPIESIELSGDPLNDDDNSTFIITKPDLLSTDEIIENLPKIWRILTELLIHQKTTQLNFDASGKSEDCYKTVDTPTGPQLVLSVSKTFIKLKDLILEKKGLQKETKRLKVLNEHLQQTLNTQEDRLGAVSVEVTKTWHLVNRMQRQHRQLHTKEQVLRYHLQQKRRMLNVLKDELETCRHKWTKAREKNENSEIQWKLLRDEFTSRKNENNSVESGYSDEDQLITSSDEDAKENGNEAAGTATINNKIPPLIIDPMDETLEQMFYRLNAIHTVNSFNFQPVAVEPPISPIITNAPMEIGSSEQVEVESVVEQSTEVFSELPPDLIDEQAEVVGIVSEGVGEGGSSSIESENNGPESSSGLTTAEEEYTTRRNDRIKRLEEQCKALFDKMTQNKKKGEELSDQLDSTIHTRQLERGYSNAHAGEGTSSGSNQGEGNSVGEGVGESIQQEMVVEENLSGESNEEIPQNNNQEEGNGEAGSSSNN